MLNPIVHTSTQAVQRLRASIGKSKPKPLIRYRVNLKPDMGEFLIMNHCFFVEARDIQEVFMHPRVRHTFLSLQQLGYDTKIDIVPFPVQPFLSDAESSNSLTVLENE